MAHELPPLPYAYNALEPHYDEATLRLHHDKHHAGYVAGQNKAEEKLAEARKSGDFALIQHWERQLAFHSSGNLLHTIFWTNMAPNAGGEPNGALAEQISAASMRSKSSSVRQRRRWKAAVGRCWAGARSSRHSTSRR